MPTYNYKCINGHFHTENRSIHAEEPVITCEECSEEMKRTYQVPVINLMGRGYYSKGG